ncbi:MAG: DinB family protein [Phycisphaerales bacterium]
MITTLIDRYVAGADAPAKAIAGLSAEELNSHPVPGKWSVQQVIAHLVDSDLIASDRMKRIAAMPRPLLIGYDETAFAAAFAQDRIDPKLACELFRLNRLHTAALLRALPPEAFERWGIHSERGKVTLRELLNDYSGHLEHHLRFIEEKRRAMGK